MQNVMHKEVAFDSVQQTVGLTPMGAGEAKLSERGPGLLTLGSPRLAVLSLGSAWGPLSERAPGAQSQPWGSLSHPPWHSPFAG